MFFLISIFKQLMLIASCANHGLSIYLIFNSKSKTVSEYLSLKNNFNKKSLWNILGVKSSSFQSESEGHLSFVIWESETRKLL